MKDAEVAAAELTGSESGPNTSTVHEPSEYALKTIVPVGLAPPVKVAVSVAEPPRAMVLDETSVEIVGEAGSGGGLADGVNDAGVVAIDELEVDTVVWLLDVEESEVVEISLFVGG